MPNWIHNTLRVQGPKNVPDLFETVSRGEGRDAFSLQSLVPMPDFLEDTTPPNTDNTPTWYEWHLRRWGTKWDTCRTTAKRGAEGITYTFDTAWSPPDNALQEIKAMFPALQFKNTWTDEYDGHRAIHQAIY